MLHAHVPNPFTASSPALHLSQPPVPHPAPQVVLTGQACHTPPPAPPKPQPAPAPDSDGLGGSFSITDPGESHPLRPYWEYLCFLFRRLEVVGEQERQEASYRDYLQVPLQPLQVGQGYGVGWGVMGQRVQRWGARG